MMLAVSLFACTSGTAATKEAVDLATCNATANAASAGASEAVKDDDGNALTAASMLEAVVDAIADDHADRIVNEGHRVIVRKATAVKNPVSKAETAHNGQAATGATVFEKWIAANSWLAPIRDKLAALGVADKSDLAMLEPAELRDLRSGLTTVVAQRKFDAELQKLGVTHDAGDAVAVAPRRDNAAAI